MPVEKLRWLVVLLPVFCCCMAATDASAAQGIPATETVEPDVDEVITLEQALDIAVRENVNLLRGAQELRRSEAQVQQQRQQFWPSLSLNIGGGPSFGRQWVEEEGTFVTDLTQSARVGTSIGMTLFDGFATQAGIRSAEFQEARQRAEIARQEQTIRFEVTQQFTQHLQHRAEIELRLTDIEFRKMLLEDVKELIRMGTRSSSDRYQMEADLADARQQFLEARRQMNETHNQLVQLLALNPDNRYRFEAPGLDASFEALPDAEELVTRGAEHLELPEALRRPPESPDQFADRAIVHRSDYQAMEYGIESATQSVRSAESFRWPTLSVSAGYNSSWSSVGHVGFLQQLDGRRGGSLRFSMSVPLTDQFQSQPQLHEAYVERTMARYDLEDLDRQIRIEVREAYEDWEIAQEMLEVAAIRLRASTMALESIEDQYRLGTSTFVEFREAANDRADASVAYVNAYYDVVISHKALDYHQGTFSSASLP